MSRQASLDDKLDGVLNHDFCPWANRYVYWLKSPLALLAITALAGLLVGLTQASQGYFVFGMLMGVIALGVVWPWIAMSGISASLRFDVERVIEGESTDVLLSLENRMPWPVWGLLLKSNKDHAVFNSSASSDGESGGHDLQFALEKTPAFSCSEFRWPFSPSKRGVYPRMTAEVGTAFPFGLYFRSRAVSLGNKLIVWPKTVPLDELPVISGFLWSQGARSSTRTGYEGDVLGTRPFRRGDLLRNVHWTQTARHGRMIVCERQAAQTARMTIVVDVDPSVHSTTDDGSTIDDSFRVAGSLARWMLQHGISVEFFLGERRIAVGVGADVTKAIFDELARFSLGDVDSQHGPFPAIAGRSVPAFVVTTESANHLKREGFSQLIHSPSSDRVVAIYVTKKVREIELGPNMLAVSAGSDALAEFRAAWRDRRAHVHLGG